MSTNNNQDSTQHNSLSSIEYVKALDYAFVKKALILIISITMDLQSLAADLLIAHENGSEYSLQPAKDKLYNRLYAHLSLIGGALELINESYDELIKFPVIPNSGDYYACAKRLMLTSHTLMNTVKEINDGFSVLQDVKIPGLDELISNLKKEFPLMEV